MSIRDWCIWKAFDEACKPAIAILADLIVIILFWAAFKVFHVVAIYLVPEDLWEITKTTHELSTVYVFAMLTAHGAMHIIKSD